MIAIKAKKNKKYKNSQRIEEALSGKKLPIVTLDEKWHELFPEENKSNEIKKLEKNLIDLMKKQGEYNNKIKELTKSKSRLMNEIVQNMEVSGTQADIKRDKKMAAIQDSINDINNQVSDMEQELENLLPEQIEQVNLQLIIESINMCYARMTANNQKIAQISEWIDAVRIQLKDNIVQKQESEEMNAKIYTYMHNMMGPELMEIFDVGEPKILAKLDGNNKSKF